MSESARLTGDSTVINAMTVDVEDYVHVSAFARAIRIEDWDRHESRVERNTQRLLDLFDERGIQATFFVLGWAAQRFPELIREIASRRHEVASHGMTHQLVYNQSPEVFREESRTSKALLEDLAQQPVLGYRAASYSITRSSLWAIDILGELGFRYDSSIFPVHHDRYGIPDAPVSPYWHETASSQKLVEFPLTTKNLWGYRLPIAGGGYFRLFPYAFTRAAFRSINRNENRSFIFYLHPWEIDAGQPRIKAGWLSEFRHYNNLDQCESRLVRLMRDFRFGTVQQVLTGLGFDGLTGSHAKAGAVLP